MSLFTKKQPSKKQPSKKQPSKNYTKEELKAVENDFDFSKIKDTKVALFVKYYILTGGNGGVAYRLSKNNKPSIETSYVGANRTLRKIRNIEGFWDLLGLGYGNLKDIVDDLKKKNPAEVAKIIMKVNKEDVIKVEGPGFHITVINPPTGDTEIIDVVD